MITSTRRSFTDAALPRPLGSLLRGSLPVPTACCSIGVNYAVECYSIDA